MRDYCSRQGWLDGYLGKSMRPERLGIIDSKDAYKYCRGWHDGHNNMIDDNEVKQYNHKGTK